MKLSIKQRVFVCRQVGVCMHIAHVASEPLDCFISVASTHTHVKCKARLCEAQTAQARPPC